MITPMAISPGAMSMAARVDDARASRSRGVEFVGDRWSCLSVIAGGIYG
jgi:hypothetical protein